MLVIVMYIVPELQGVLTLRWREERSIPGNSCCFIKGVRCYRVTRMAYSPSLWLMAIGW